jgi:predicted transcriptional regulator of viral defense system
MSRSLSALESKLILRLEWEKKRVIDINSTARILGISANYARVVLHRLDSDNWLKQIVPGQYELIPAERGEYPFPDTNPFFIGSQLVSPYYFSYATSGYHHGLTTQAPGRIYIATKEGLTQLRIVRGTECQVVNLPQAKFFGFKEVDAYGQPVQMAEIEKTILDSLDRPQYAGDIPEIATMLWRGRNRLDWEKLSLQTEPFRSKSLNQRLGYLLKTLNLEVPVLEFKRLATSGGKTTCYLGALSRWGKGGDFDPTWNVVDNIPRAVLLADTENV